MALDGGGGGGPVGIANSFVGPAEALEIVGDFAYAYSGTYPASTTPATQLKFTTGNYLFVGEVRQVGMIDPDGNLGDGRIEVVTIKMNGAIVMLSKVDAQNEAQPSSDVMPIIIPAYTQMEFIVDSTSTEANFLGTLSITGRIYR
jgi:hypothetical protein